MHVAGLIFTVMLTAAAAGGLFVALELLRRRIANHRGAVVYDPARNQVFVPQAPGAHTCEVELIARSFVWPRIEGKWGTAWLELPVSTGLMGRVVEPYLECRCDGRVVRQYVEREAAGKRWFNLTGLTGDRDIAGSKVELTGKHLQWSCRSARLLLLPPADPPPGPLLVLSPHPDDAEIAAFGTYSRSPAWVVTLTLGDNGPSHYAEFFTAPAAAYAEKARTRVWDSMTIPQLGGVPAERIINLGYFDGTLEQMYRSPDTPASGLVTGEKDISTLRRNPLDSGAVPTEATWRNLVADLRAILEQARPAAIVLPHPRLDPHPDHQYTTIALIEALQATRLAAEQPQGKLLFYSNHAIGTELYPFGPNDGVISIPPMHDAGAYFESMWSVPLDSCTRLRKQIALEAHHDLRQAPQSGSRKLWEVLREALRSPYVYLVGVNNDYVRRAARCNELFFTVDYERAARVRDDFLDRAAR